MDFDHEVETAVNATKGPAWSEAWLPLSLIVTIDLDISHDVTWEKHDLTFDLQT